MKCVSKIVEKRFDDVEVEDYVIFRNYCMGKFVDYSLKKVTRKSITTIHAHEYLVIGNEKWYKHDNSKFRVLVLEAKGKKKNG